MSRKSPRPKRTKPPTEPAERPRRPRAKAARAPSPASAPARRLDPAAALRLRRLSVVVAAPLAGIVLYVGFLLLVYPSRSLPGGPGTVRYTVPDAASAGGVADDLGRLGVVDSPLLFSSYLSLRGAGTRLRRGRTVELPLGATPRDVAQRLARGFGGKTVRVTIPEGLTRFEIADRLARAGLGSREALLEAMADPRLLRSVEAPGPTLEGYLFPDTYEFREDDDPVDVVGRMVDTFARRVEPLFDRHSDALERLREADGMGPHEVLVLASVVEEEAALAEERPRIAGVFFNRLRSDEFLPRRRLQSDPTVSYGCRADPALASCAGFHGPITRAMLEGEDNPYNTYRHAGLPPGPIANPGLAAIEAVLAPEAHGYYYFVATGGRRHRFSRTLEGHNGAVDDARARGVLP